MFRLSSKCVAACVLSSVWTCDAVRKRDVVETSQLEAEEVGTELLEPSFVEEALEVENTTFRYPTEAEIQEFVGIHNKYRCMHGQAPVAWSVAMAENAATYIGPRTTMEHSASYSLPPPAGPAGENLYWSSGGATATAAVAAWYNEVKDCIGGPSGFTDGCLKGVNNAVTGHFTALIWKGVKTIGCAFSDSKAPTLIICRYKAGDTLSLDTPNMNGGSGNYIKQVFPLSVPETQCGLSVPAPAPVVGSTTRAPVVGTTTRATTKAPVVGSSTRAAVPSTTVTTTKIAIDYENCVPLKSRGQCQTCTHTTQCAAGFCCPFLKKCVPTSSTPCSYPVAACRPTCFAADVTTCACADKNFPANWLGTPCTATKIFR